VRTKGTGLSVEVLKGFPDLDESSRSMLSAGPTGRFVAVSADLSVWVHDFHCPAAPLYISDKLNSRSDENGTGDQEGCGKLNNLRGTVRHLHVERNLLVVVTEDTSGEFHIDDADFGSSELGSGNLSCQRIFAWHLPSCRPLLAGHESISITALGRTGMEECGLNAFAGMRPTARDSSASFLVLHQPGAARRSVRRSNRRSVQSHNDIRARGFNKQGRLHR